MSTDGDYEFARRLHEELNGLDMRLASFEDSNTNKAVTDDIHVSEAIATDPPIRKRKRRLSSPLRAIQEEIPYENQQPITVSSRKKLSASTT